MGEALSVSGCAIPTVAFATLHGALSSSRSILQQQVRSSSFIPIMGSSGRSEPDGDEDDDLIESGVNRLSTFLSQPTPGLASLKLGFPLVLASSTLLVPLPTVLLLCIFFVGFAYLGRQVIDDIDDKVDFAALGAAIASAGLLSPFGFWRDNQDALQLVAALGLIGVSVAILVEAAPSKEEKLLDEWDDKFDKEDEPQEQD